MTTLAFGRLTEEEKYDQFLKRIEAGEKINFNACN
jgi:hypothetical protein